MALRFARCLTPRGGVAAASRVGAASRAAGTRGRGALSAVACGPHNVFGSHNSLARGFGSDAADDAKRGAEAPSSAETPENPDGRFKDMVVRGKARAAVLRQRQGEHGTGRVCEF